MKIDVSNGEIFDKKSILLIKSEKIKDEEQLKNIQYELDLINIAVSNIYKKLKIKDMVKCQDLFSDLVQVNTVLWQVEDDIRNKEQKKEFDKGFIELARKVYFNNDKRARIKKEINEITDSKIIEEKSYEDYG